MITDPISDMLTRIRNAAAVRKTEVAIPHSKVKFAIAKILEQEGFVQSVQATGEGIHKAIVVGLKYQNREPAFRSLKRVSKPGHRVYRKADELKQVLSGFGVSIISTPNGLMTNKEARSRRLGGEVVCEVF